MIPAGGSDPASASFAANERVIGAGTQWGTFGPGMFTNYIRIVGDGVEGRGNNL